MHIILQIPANSTQASSLRSFHYTSRRLIKVLTLNWENLSFFVNTTLFKKIVERKHPGSANCHQGKMLNQYTILNWAHNYSRQHNWDCQYQCNWLSGKTRLWNALPYHVSNGTLNSFWCYFRNIPGTMIHVTWNSKWLFPVPMTTPWLLHKHFMTTPNRVYNNDNCDNKSRKVITVNGRSWRATDFQQCWQQWVSSVPATANRDDCSQDHAASVPLRSSTTQSEATNSSSIKWESIIACTKLVFSNPNSQAELISVFITLQTPAYAMK